MLLDKTEFVYNKSGDITAIQEYEDKRRHIFHIATATSLQNAIDLTKFISKMQANTKLGNSELERTWDKVYAYEKQLCKKRREISKLKKELKACKKK